MLTDDEVLALARLGVRVEEHYGAPQDIEWAIAGGKTYLVQSRPITTLRAPDASRATRRRTTCSLRGLGASPGVASGSVRVLQSPADGERAPGRARCSSRR